MTEEKKPGECKEHSADEPEREESLAEEVSEGKSLAGRVAEKVGKKAGKRLKDGREQ